MAKSKTTYFHSGVNKVVKLLEGDEWWRIWWCKTQFSMSTYSQNEGPNRVKSFPRPRNPSFSFFSEQLLKNSSSKIHAHRYRLTACPNRQVDKQYGQHHARTLSRYTLEGWDCHRKGGPRLVYRARYRQTIAPENFIYQSGFPIQFLDWMRWTTCQRAYPVIHCDPLTLLDMEGGAYQPPFFSKAK
jgi:hypothetical protein